MGYTKRMSGLFALTARYRLAPTTKTNPTTWKNERGKPCVMPAGHNFIKVDGYLNRGQCAIIHSHVVHGSEANTSNTFRRALLGGFVSVDAKLLPGKHMKREPIDLYSMNKKYWK